MEITGRLQSVSETQKITDKFQKREFVVTLEPDGKYPQPILFQFTQDKVSALDGYKLGTDVQVHFNLRGRENGGRVWNTLEAWRIVNLAAENHAAQKPTFNAGDPNANDDLPF